MQIVRQNCENCVGPTREACDAVYAGIREKTTEVITSVIGMELRDEVVGVMESQSDIAQIATEAAVEIKTLGCTLPQADLMTAVISEYVAGAALVDTEAVVTSFVEEQEIERLNSFVDEAQTLLAEGSAMLERVEQEVADAQAEATHDFCEAQGWDPENLSFVQRMDLQFHLRSEGYIN